MTLLHLVLLIGAVLALLASLIYLVVHAIRCGMARLDSCLRDSAPGVDEHHDELTDLDVIDRRLVDADLYLIPESGES